MKAKIMMFFFGGGARQFVGFVFSGGQSVCAANAHTNGYAHCHAFANALSFIWKEPERHHLLHNGQTAPANGYLLPR